MLKTEQYTKPSFPLQSRKMCRKCQDIAAAIFFTGCFG